ncbi:hypothetical protein [Cupriavidus alkaliphilus]|uniref:hypothetical protein n=1 Tax=Cupriavidus alkaliphilus TaxID=942866 RepID=UPI00161EC729|nr:hypothetical protein [Cupriavidus alkaliphilus]MBB2918193.1 hypothetical protein [Cupriavidus alkaliphilus]
MRAFVRYDQFSFIPAGRLLLASLAILCVSCSSRPTGYGATEKNITARGGIVGEAGLFHDIVYNPEAIGLTFPGYIVGLDKGRQAAVIGDAVLPAPRDSDIEAIRDFKTRLNTEPKLHYISHVVRNEGRPYGNGNCILYSIYRDWGSGEKGMSFSENEVDRNFGCGGDFPIFGRPASAFPDSWTGLDVLAKELERQFSERDAASAYTQAIVIVMGWNTPQLEAVRNFNSVLSHLQRAAGPDFRPLVIGVTWASSWSANWLEPLVTLSSYRAKANDADEIGFTWLAEVVRVVQQTTAGRIPTVAIGHSFGARALATALCMGSQIERSSLGQEPSKSQARRSVPWNLFIAWQGAFSINRFGKGSSEGFKYDGHCGDIGAIVLTSSSHDQANTKSSWSDTVGSYEVFRQFCGEGKFGSFNRLDVQCIRREEISAEGGHRFRFTAGMPNYVDASNIVYFNQPNTGGGAHSDIFRPIHGRFIWAAIQSLEWTPPGSHRTQQRTATEPSSSRP